MRPAIRLGACGALLAIVLVRFFTETLAVLPRAMNAIDLPLTAGFAGGILLLTAIAGVPLRTAGTAPYLAAFATASFASLILNLDIVLLPAAVLFLVGHLLPILFCVLLFHADLGPDFGTMLRRTFLGAAAIGVVLGIRQIPLVFSDPDALSLAFGSNANQGALFLAFTLAIVVGRWYCGVAGALEKLLGVVCAPLFFLAGFKAMWVLFPVLLVGTMVLAGVGSLRTLGRTAVAVLLVGVVTAGIVSIVPLPELRYFSAFRTVDFSTFGKVRIVQQAPAIVAERPWGPLVGLGPGTMTSRAFRTFADLPNRGTGSDVTFSLIPPTYRNRYSDQYVVPLVSMSNWQLSSGTVEWPFTSYVSLFLESGLIGFAGIIGVYGVTWLRLLQLGRTAHRKETRAAAIGGAVGLATLLAAAVLDNWLEQTRVATLAWALVLMAWYEARAERDATQPLEPA